MERITIKSNGLAFDTHRIYKISSNITNKKLTKDKEESRIIPTFEYYAILTAAVKVKDMQENRTVLKTESSRSMRSRLTYMYIVGSLLNEDDDFCDLGAHVGMIGHFCAQYTTGKVVMYECNLDKWDESRRLGRNNGNKDISKVFNNCHYEYSAVSIKSGKTSFFINKEKSVGSSINRHLAGRDVEKREVPMTSIEEVLTLHNPNVIKMNVEGEDAKIIETIMEKEEMKGVKKPRTIIFEITWTDGIEEIIKKCIDFFESTLLIELNQPTGQTQMKAQIGKKYLERPAIKPHHIIVSFEQEATIIERISKAISEMNKRWEFTKSVK